MGSFDQIDDQAWGLLTLQLTRTLVKMNLQSGKVRRKLTPSVVRETHHLIPKKAPFSLPSLQAQ
jgi:hypothetical protein